MRITGLISVAVCFVVGASWIGCVGDDPATTDTSTVDDAGPASSDASDKHDGDVPALSPDAAPPAGCPLGCLPPAPAGWVGPSAVYDGVPATKPAACPAPYTLLEVDAHQGVTAAAATCACGAPTFAGTKCTATIEGWSSNTCTGGGFPTFVDSIQVPGAPCAESSFGTGNGLRVTAPTLTRGTCSYASPQKTLPDPVFDKVDVACGLPQIAACENRPDCAVSPIPEAPFTRLCIHKEGDVSCPSADYSNRFVSFKKVAESRDCSPCTGTTGGGSCGNGWGLNNGPTCNTAPTTHAGGACINNPGVGAIINGAAMAPSGVTCTAAGGEPIGTATDDDPVTFCCNK